MSDDQTKVTIRMPAALHKELRIAAIHHDTTVQALTVEAIEKHLASIGG
ncbi:MAG: hypothetical protein WAV90_12600 [Gordonia amarae]